MQFFAVQFIVAAAWPIPFSISKNFISDLAAVHCDVYPPQSGQYICSPWHTLMNASMLLQGFLIAGGGLALHATASPVHRKLLNFLLILSAIGSCLVAAFPEDQAPKLHYMAAALHIVCGNVALLLLAPALTAGSGIARLVAAMGSIGLVATIALPFGQYLGLGVGGMERVAVYPLPLCLGLIGLHTLNRRCMLDNDTDRLV